MVDVGMNLSLSGNSYYGTEYPFIDRFKTSGAWSVQGLDWRPMDVPVPVDADGFPTGLPAGARQIYAMIGVDPVALPTTDRYILTYEGNAAISVGSSRIVSTEPGKIVFDFAGDGNSLQLALSAIDGKDPIHDIHIVREDQQALFDAGEIFNPVFLDKTSDWSVLRFMQWEQTNTDTVAHWEDRAKASDASWGQSVPIEVMVRLANEAGADMWYNVPTHADDGFVRGALEYIKQHLAPGLKVHLEYSNEVWNWGFAQANYAREMGDQVFGQNAEGGWVKYYGYRSAQIAAISDAVFGDQSATRVDKVLSTQTAWTGLENYIFQGVAAAHVGSVGELFDEYAITTYFGSSLMGYTDADRAKILSWARGGEAGVDAAFSEIATGGQLSVQESLLEAKRLDAYQAAVAARYGLDLVAYEGGIHVTATNYAGDVQGEIVAFFTRLMNDPRIGDLYKQMAADFDAVGGSLLVNFQDASAPSTYGNWGLLDSIYQDSSPRYDALLAVQQEALANPEPQPTPPASTPLPTLQPLPASVRPDKALINPVVQPVATDAQLAARGDTAYLVDDQPLAISEADDGGIDMVRTSRKSHVLEANVENMRLFTTASPYDDTAARDGVGNDLMNSIEGNAGANQIAGMGGDDRLYGHSGNDILHGNDGNDYIDGGTGADQMAGDAGDDTYVVDDAGDSVFEVAGGGTDMVLSLRNSYALDAEVENLRLYTTSAPDDERAARDGIGNALANVIDGTGGVNQLAGMGGNDRLYGYAGDDIIHGNDGDDFIDGGAGADQMAGDAGDDTYIVDDAGDMVSEVAGGGTDTVLSQLRSYQLAGQVEQLRLYTTASADADVAARDGIGNALANVIDGNGGVNQIAGRGGNDRLYGHGGDDMIHGNDGDDFIDGGAGADQMAGDAGDDTYIVDDARDAVFEQAGQGTDTVLSLLSSYRLTAQVEQLRLYATASADADVAGRDGVGNDLANVIDGNGGVNQIAGRGGDDRLYGHGGDDLIHGNNGDDFIDGGAGADQMAGDLGDDIYVVDDIGDRVFETAGQGTDTVRSWISLSLSNNVENLELLGSDDLSAGGNALDNVILGNAGANRITGGRGADSLTGGAGSDTFVYRSVAESGAGGIDHIHDFSAAEGDRIDLSGINVATGGRIEGFHFVTGDRFTGVRGELISVATGNGIYTVQGDVDGDGAADLTILVNAQRALTSHDFTL